MSTGGDSVTTRPPPRTSSISTWDTQASSGNHDSNLDLDTFSSFPPGNIQASAASFELPERTMPPQLELTGQPSFGGEIYLDHPTTTTSILDCHGLRNPQNDPGPCEYQLNWLWKDSWGSSKMSYQDPYGLWIIRNIIVSWSLIRSPTIMSQMSIL